MIITVHYERRLASFNRELTATRSHTHTVFGTLLYGGRPAAVSTSYTALTRRGSIGRGRHRSTTSLTPHAAWTVSLCERQQTVSLCGTQHRGEHAAVPRQRKQRARSSPAQQHHHHQQQHKQQQHKLTLETHSHNTTWVYYTVVAVGDSSRHMTASD